MRVNSNFNEQKLDGDGYAQPDCADEDLVAAGGENEGCIITTDLWEGFFGIRPGAMPDAFFDGASVTIEKIAANDTETGQIESGQVRFYAIYDLGKEDEYWWEIPTTTFADNVTTLTNLVPVLYADDSDIPYGPDVQYYVEGIQPGPLTLKFTYDNGVNPPLSQTQKFLVATQQCKYDWQQEIRQAILLETGGGVDMNNYVKISNVSFFFGNYPFTPNKAYIQSIYAYYEELYHKSSDLFLWSGLAKMAGGAVYGSMVDAEYGRTTTLSVIYPEAGNSLSDFFQDTLMDGNWDIFDDLAWQFHAYQASGIWALRYVNQTHQDGSLSSPKSRAIDIQTWNLLYQGDYSGNSGMKQIANLRLTNREQQYIVQTAFDLFHNIGPTIFGVNLGNFLALLAQSPLPGGSGFSSVVSGGDITKFDDRWKWINRPTGIWLRWISTYDASARSGLAGIPLQINSESFSFFCSSNSTLYPIIW